MYESAEHPTTTHGSGAAGRPAGSPGDAASRRRLRRIALGLTTAAAGAVAMVLAATLTSSPAEAVPADPTPFTLTQPNGDTFRAVRFGDEYYHGLETRTGYTIEQGRRGWWRYAETTPTGRLSPTGPRVGDTGPRTRRHLRDEVLVARAHGESKAVAEARGDSGPNAAPSLGSDPSLVILAQFTDQASLGTTPSSWATRFFTGAKSASSYYREVSYSQFDLAPASETSGTVDDGIVGWVNTGEAHNDNSSSAAKQSNARAAIYAADPYVNFASYDTNSDGYVTAEELHVTVIAAGQERATCDGYCTYKAVWGHMSTLSTPAYVDGKYVGGNGYTMFGEMQGYTQDATLHQATIGIIVHELGHDLGLPDLYDYDGPVNANTSEGIGNWSVMGGGSWRKLPGETYSGTTPVHFDAWSKWVKGWISPTQVTGTQTKQVNAAASATSSGVAVQLLDNPGGAAWNWGSAGTGEYFLVENRERIAGTFDASLPGDGLVVYHVDEAQPTNSIDTHRLVDVVEADGLDQLDQIGNRGDAGDPFPGTSSNRTLNGTTYPNTDLYSGAESGVAITSIPDATTAMTATFTAPGSGPAPNDAFANATGITSTRFTDATSNTQATWQTDLEQVPTCSDLDRTVWWRYTTTRPVRISVDTLGSDFDSVLAVWQGTSLGSLTPLKCNDDASTQGGPSAVPEFVVQPGTYYFQVGSWYQDSTHYAAPGNVTFHFSARPLNDDFADAATITGGTGTVNGNNDGATKQTGEPNHAAKSGGASVWWSWTAPTTGSYTFDTLGSAADDTLLGIYTGTSVDALTMRAENDDIATNSNNLSRAILEATAGTTYRIAVDGYGTAAANRDALTLSWAPTTVAGADVSLAMTGQASGSQATFTITAANAGPGPATGATISDDLPAGVTLVSATSADGTCSGTTTVTCDLDPIAEAGQAQVTVVVDVAAPGQVTNTASVSTPGDPDATNDTASKTVTVIGGGGGETPTLTAGAGNLPGLVFGYLFEVTGGNSNATGVVVTVDAPGAARVVDAGTDQVSCTGTTTLTCNLGTVAAGEVVDVVVTALPLSAGPHTATGTLSVDGSTADSAWATAAVDDVCDNSSTGGADRVVGSAADEVLCGAGGNDVLLGGRGDDLLLGGPGADTISYENASTAVTVDLRNQGLDVATGWGRTGVGDGTDLAVGVERVRGTRFADLIRGGAHADSLWGLAGADTLYGYAKVDHLYGAGGPDTLIGGTGRDVLSGGGANDSCRDARDQQASC